MRDSRPPLENGSRPAPRHRHGLGRDLIRLIDKPLHPVDGEDAVPQHIGHRASPHLLDHQAEQQIVDVPVLEGVTDNTPPGWHQLQHVGWRPHLQQIGGQELEYRRPMVWDTAAMAQQITDRRLPGVELEIPRKVVSGQVVD